MKVTRLTEVGLLSLTHPFTAACSAPRRWPRLLEPQITCNIVQASRCPWSLNLNKTKKSLDGLGGDLPAGTSS